MGKPEEKKSKAHSELSASGAYRWLRCPGSVRLEKEAPPEKESRYAAEGTHAHKLFEKWILHLNGSHGAFTIPNGFPKNMVEAVKISIGEVGKIWKKSGGALESEKKISLAHIDPVMFGTLDVRIVEHYGTLYVFDYKHGAGVPVDIQDPNSSSNYGHNPQLIYYALGAAHECDYDFNDVVIGITQPRAIHHEGHTRSRRLSIAHLKSYEHIFRKGVDRVRSKDPKLFAGSWCQFCKAKSICPEKRKVNQSKSAIAFASVPIEDVI